MNQSGYLISSFGRSSHHSLFTHSATRCPSHRVGFDRISTLPPLGSIGFHRNSIATLSFGRNYNCRLGTPDFVKLMNLFNFNRLYAKRLLTAAIRLLIWNQF